MRLAACLLALAAAAAGLSACGGDDDRREAYERYVSSAGAAHAGLQPGFEQAQEALRSFADGGTPENAQELRDAAATVRSAQAALAVVQPPEEARRLHEDLLRLLDLQASLAQELGLAAEYVPQADEALRAPAEAAAALRKALADSEEGADQSVALRRYGRALGESLDRFGRLAPPPVLLAWHDAQLEQVRVSKRLAGELAAAIDANDRPRIERVLDSYADALPDARAVAIAQRSAVRAFNRRLQRQQQLQERILREEAEIVLDLS